MVKWEVIMSTGTRRRYTEEFKKEAVRLVCESAHPVAQVARDLGIREHVWSRWRTQHRPAEAQGPTPAAQCAEAEELTRMEREWARVTPKRDCLQRAAAWRVPLPLSHPAHVPHTRLRCIIVPGFWKPE